MKINYILRTRPRAKARPGFTVVKRKDPVTGKKKVVIFHNKKGDEMVKEIIYNPLQDEEKNLGALVRSIPLKGVAVPLSGTLAVQMIFCKDGIRLVIEEVEDIRPKRLVADISNYAKFPEDALNKIVWADDKQIVDLRARFSLRSVDEEPDETELREKSQAELELGGQSDPKNSKVPF